MVGHVRGRRWAAACGLIICSTWIAGCDEHALVISPSNLDTGLVIVLPGIDGVAFHTIGLGEALRDVSVPAAVELWNWTSVLGPLFNQTAMAHNREMAALLARRIGRYRREHPNGSVILIGHSGGTAIAAWAAESLDVESGDIDGIIMLGSSLSPGYDLTGALLRVRRGIVNVYSSGDVGLLGAGTALVGTMDRRNGVGAGMVGFVATRKGLYQIPWNSTMAKYGYYGDHFSCCARQFVQAYLAPLVTAEFWDQERVNSLGGDRKVQIAAAPE